MAIVDDDPRLLESVGDLLESAGYAVRAFRSAEALLSSGLLGVDVLVTDIGLPGMDGLVLRDEVRRTRPDLPVFLITGRHEIAEQSRALGISHLFRKPFDAGALLGAISIAIRDRQGEGKHARR